MGVNRIEQHSNYLQTLKKISRFAQAVNAEIHSFQPDVIIVLARGGFGPLWALEARWEETNDVSHPPVIITNLGREKIIRYEYHREVIGQSFMPELEPFDFYGPGERGYFLAWLAKQIDWRCELRQQIQKGLGSDLPPARILVIDDYVNKGYTTLIAIGLLLAEFPEAETRMLTGNLPNWRPDLSAPWVKEHADKLSKLTEKEIQDCVYNFAPGVGDIDPASLQWEPLNPNSQAKQGFGRFLQAEPWLDLSIWIKDQITTFVRQSIGHDGMPLLMGEALDGDFHRPVLTDEELSFRNRWLTANLTPQEASNELDLSIEDAIKLLKDLAAG